MRQQLLDGHGQGAVEGREVLQEISFLAEPKAIDDRNAVRPVEGSESIGHFGVRVRGEVTTDIRKVEVVIVHR